jgi:PAS domain S-box-containing protein
MEQAPVPAVPTATGPRASRLAEALAAVGEIVRLLTHRAPIASVAAALAEGLARLLPAPGVALYRCEDGRAEPALLARAGEEPALPAGALTVLAGGRTPATAGAPGAPWLVWPLLVRDRLIGLLAVRVPEGGLAPEERELVQVFAHHGVLALGGARLLQRTERRRQEAEALARVARQLTEPLSVAAVSERIVEGALALFAAPSAVVRLRQPDGTLVVTASGGPAAASFPVGAVLGPGLGVVGQAMARERSRWTRDLLADPDVVLDDRLREGNLRAGTGSVLAVPLRASGRVLGALSVADRAGRDFAADEIALAEALADQGALALERARLYEAVTARADRLGALARLQQLVSSSLDLGTVLGELARAAATLLGLPMATFWMEEEEGAGILVGRTYVAGPPHPGAPPAVRRRPTGQGLVGWVARHRAPLTVDDRFADPRSVETELLAAMGLRGFHGEPVIVGDRSLGVLSLAARGPIRLSAEDRELLDILIAQAATALGNARLYQEAERRGREAEVLAGAARAAAASFDLDQVLQQLAESAREICGSDLAHIALRSEGEERYVFRHWAGERRTGPQPFAVEPGRGLGGLVLATGRPARTDDYAGDPRISKDFLPPVQAEGIVGSLCVPIRLDDRVEGLLFADSRSRAFTERDEAKLLRLADHAAVAIRSARLFGAERRARGEAEEAGRRFLDLVEGLDAIVWERDVESGRLTFMSRQAEAVLGYPTAAWLEDPGFWLAHVHPEDRDRMEAAARGAADVGPQGAAHEYRMLAADGRTVWLRDRVQAVRDAGGRPTLLRGLSVDITEVKALEAQLLHSQKMEAIGRLAGGVAHDFNNLLTVISGRVELILARLDAGHPLREDVALVQRAAERAAALTAQLLTFSRKQVLRPQPVGLDATLAGTEPLLRRVIGEDVELVTRGRATGLVLADRVQLEQVLLNLVVNARDAMPDGGRLTIETGDQELDEAAARRLGMPPGRYAVLRVQDTGVGMDARTQARIFEPFFTTKGEGRGTGLGLATVYGIVTQSGGHVTVSSAPGRGATFTVYLPWAPAAGAEPAPEAAPRPGRGVGVILLVEDEEEVRDLARDILAGRGYTVLEAATPEAALAQARAGEPIDLLLTDVVMPRINGRELAERLRALRPGLPVLYMSGYTDDALLHRGVAAPGAHFLQKPFSPAALLRRVHEVLAGGGTPGGGS